VRIERLWLNLTLAFGHKWYEFFHKLEFRHGLDINSSNHIWLLHHLFLPSINREVAEFVDTWNNHRIQIRQGTGRTPIDMYVFDMLALGERGDRPVPPEELEMLSPDDVETFGVDWAGLYDMEIRRSHQANNPVSEGIASWHSRSGPPPLETLSNVDVEPPVGVLNEVQADALKRFVESTMGHFDEPTLIQRWTQGLAFAAVMHPGF
jgi:hypothetical protein